MGTPPLVGDIEAGQKLVAALDAARIKVRAAFWYYAEEASEWRLALVMPSEGEGLKRDLYEAVQKSIRREQIGLPLSRIVVIDPSAPLARSVRGAFPRTSASVIVTPGTGTLSTSGYAGDCVVSHVYRST